MSSRPSAAPWGPARARDAGAALPALRCVRVPRAERGAVPRLRAMSHGGRGTRGGGRLPGSGSCRSELPWRRALDPQAGRAVEEVDAVGRDVEDDGRPRGGGEVGGGAGEEALALDVEVDEGLGAEDEDRAHGRRGRRPCSLRSIRTSSARMPTMVSPVGSSFAAAGPSRKLMPGVPRNALQDLAPTRAPPCPLELHSGHLASREVKRPACRRPR